MNGLASTERRITLRLLSYWEKLRGTRVMPTESDVRAEDLQDLWDHCFLIHFTDTTSLSHHYSYLGDAVAFAYNGHLADDGADGMVAHNASKLSAYYAQVVKTQRPVIDEGEFFNASHEMIKYRQCLLPLGNNGKVSAIFGGMRYKIFK